MGYFQAAQAVWMDFLAPSLSTELDDAILMRLKLAERENGEVATRCWGCSRLTKPMQPAEASVPSCVDSPVRTGFC